MYYYKYMFFKIYSYLKDGNWALYPQIETILIISFLPLTNIFLLLFLINLVGLHEFNFEFITSQSVKFLIVIFVSVFLFNHLYFFWINNWKEIIIHFREKEEMPNLNKIVNVYIKLSVLSIVAIYFVEAL